MLRYKTGLIFTLVSFLFLMPVNHPGAQDTAESVKIFPEPEPFSLDAGSAVYCISLLKNNHHMEKNTVTGKYRIIEVDSVWSWFLDYDTSYPEGYRKRYDIIVNGSPLDWNDSYIEYGEEMMNMRMLFLYRNQVPPDNFDVYYSD